MLVNKSLKKLYENIKYKLILILLLKLKISRKSDKK
jgi:hypothetical protein